MSKSRSGTAPPETDPERLRQIRARLDACRRKVGGGEIASWRTFAHAIGRSTPGDMPGWYSGRLRVREETIAAIEAMIGAAPAYYRVRLEPGCWLADWDGDPGQTLNTKHVKRFKTVRDARIALALARSHGRTFPDAVIEGVVHV